jgi:predicted Zn-dependent protease
MPCIPRILRCCILAAGVIISARAVNAHGDGHAVIAAVTERLQAQPGNTVLLLERSALLAQHGDFAPALLDLQEVRRLEPGNDRELVLRGSVLRRAGQLQEAREALEAFQQKYPRNHQSGYELAQVLAALGDTPAALPLLDGLIAAAEHPAPDAVALRLRQTVNDGAEGPARALTWLDGFLERHPLPVFHEEALKLEIQLGRTAGALRRLDSMIAKAPRPESLYLRKAALLASAGDSAGAQAAARSALEALAKLPPHLASHPSCTAMKQQAMSILQP